jgi:hypothetical protein
MKYPPDLPPDSVRHLWEGCVLVTIAEAFDTALSGSAYWIGSWDGSDYRLDNENGDLGTVCFRGDSLVALFFGHASQRSPLRYPENAQPLDWYIPMLPSPLMDAIDRSALPFLRSRASPTEQVPVTAAFWGEGKTFSAREPWDSVFCNGAFLLEVEFRDRNEILLRSIEEHHLPRDVGKLVLDVAIRKFNHPDETIVITEDERSTLLANVADQNQAVGHMTSTSARIEAENNLKLCSSLLSQLDIVLS